MSSGVGTVIAKPICLGFGNHTAGYGWIVTVLVIRSITRATEDNDVTLWRVTTLTHTASLGV